MLHGFSRWKCRSASLLLRVSTPRQARSATRQRPPGPLLFKASYISVATLNPELFDFLNQPISDISGLKHTKVHIHMGADDVLRTKLFYLTTDPDLRFPEGTRGFLYYKGHRRYPLIAGALRFRVLPEGTDDFEMGHDLTMPDGTPWQRVLSKVGDTLPVFIEKLVEEKLLLRNFWDLRQTVHLSQPPPNEPKRERKPRAKRPPPPPKPKVIRHTNLMYTKDDTFTLDLTTAHGTFSIYDPTVDSTFRTLQLWYIFRDRRKVYQSRMGHGLVPYRGSISGRFELSTLAEHQAEGGHIVMRILDILKPVELLIPHYDGFINPPVPGELLLRGLPSRRRPWRVLLDESERGLVLRKLFSEDKKDK